MPQETQLSPQEQETLRLEQQLNEARVAENFFETATGKLTVELLTREITRLVNRVTSDDFLKDHVGYVNCLADLRANKNLLRRLQVAGSPVRIQKLKEKLTPEV